MACLHVYTQQERRAMKSYGHRKHTSDSSLNLVVVRLGLCRSSRNQRLVVVNKIKKIKKDIFAQCFIISATSFPFPFPFFFLL